MDESRSDPRRGYAALVAGVAAIGVAPLFVRSISASALAIGTYASWVAALACIVVAWRCGVPLTRAVFVTALPGGVAFALTQVLAFSAFQETSLAIASLITSMTPLIVVIAAVPLFGEKLRPVQLVWAALALVGVTAVILGAQDGGGNTLTGDLFAVGSLIAGAGVMLLMKHRRMGGVGASAYAAGMFLVAALVETPVLLVAGEGGGVSGQEWLWLVLLALVLAAGMGMMTWAQRHVSVAISSVLALGATVITAVGAWIFFDQPLGALQIVGGIVVLVSLGGLVLSQIGSPNATIVEPAWLPEAQGSGGAGPG